MSISDKQLQAVNSLDFKNIKQDLIAFLSGQDQFKDYDFEGSSMSILLDILAYNTHHNAYYANMLANESFLDSSILRGSTVSLAKSLGYRPRSRRGAEVIVDIQLIDTNNSVDNLIRRVNSKQFRVIKNEIFKTSFNGNDFFFYAVDGVNFEYEGEDSDNNPQIFARNVLLREGKLKTKTFVVNKQFGSDQRFIIPDENLDDRSVTVFVKKSQTESEGSRQIWSPSKNILENNSESRVFFLDETFDGSYEVYFGDGIVGKPVEQGNVILVSYASCSGINGNNAGRDDSPTNESFAYIPSSPLNTGIPSSVQFITRVLRDENDNPVISYGGQNKETRDSIKFYAPRSYETQDRAVTINDYVTILQQNYSSNIGSIHAWGGEDAIPPSYGKIFIAIKPRNGLFLSTQEKISIEKSIIAEKNIVSITPQIVDPDYLFLIPTVNVKYDTRVAKKSLKNIEDLVYTYVRAYGLRNLSSFEKNFYSGSMIKNIIDIDESIKSCELKLSLNKVIYPQFNRKISYLINFENSLSPTTTDYYIQSSVFRTYGRGQNVSNLPAVNAYFRDNTKGKISLYNEETQAVIVENYGSVDYESGVVSLNSAQFLLNSDLSSYQVFVEAVPRELDVLSSRETILEMDREKISVNITPVSTVIM